MLENEFRNQTKPIEVYLLNNIISTLTKYRIQTGVVCLIILGLLFIGAYVKINSEYTQQTAVLKTNEESIASLSAQVKSLLKENDILKNEDLRSQLTTINNVVDKYEFLRNKMETYKAQGAVVTTIEGEFTTVTTLIFQKKYTEADTLLSKIDADLEAALKAKQTADAAAKPKTTTSTNGCSGLPSSGYCKTTVNGLTTHILAGSVGQVRTITANSDNCSDQCPTKSLQSYIGDNGGFAGINGTYFCPPDYSSCAGKTNSYDFPVYNSNLGKWINEDKLHWSNRAMLAFTSSSAHFYPASNSFSGLSGIKAAIVNNPGLVQNGQNIVGQYSLTSAQNAKGTRGGVAVKGSSVYLIVVTSASVNDIANVMVKLGVTHGLNLDGGGSSALYSGGYKVGPGRSLPNALILK